MPFYLVTQTTLIKAEDPQRAAQSAIDLIRSGIEVSVTVKHDQTDMSHVVVGARVDPTPSSVAVCQTVEDQTKPATKTANVISTPENRSWIGKLMDAMMFKRS